MTIAPKDPSNLEMEQALLGGLLFQNAIYYEVADFLRPEHFYDPVHGRIYERACGLIRSGRQVDGYVLKTWADSDEGMKELDGHAYLVLLQDRAAPALLAVEYAKDLYDLALKRDLIRIAAEAALLARDADAEQSAETQIEEASRKLSALTGARATAQIITAAGVIDAVFEHLDAPPSEAEGIKTGIRALDLGSEPYQNLGDFVGGDFVIVGGATSMGKTVLGVEIGLNNAWEGVSTAFFSLEMDARRKLGMRIASSVTHRLYGEDAPMISQISNRTLTRVHRDMLSEARDTVRQAPIYFDSRSRLTVGQILSTCRRLQATSGLDLVIIDYLQLVRATTAYRGQKVHEVGEISADLKDMAKALDVPVIALSQLNRAPGHRDNKRPTKGDLRDSGNLEQDADIILLPFRDAYYAREEGPPKKADEFAEWQMRVHSSEIEIIVAKNRNGPTFTAKTIIDLPHSRIAPQVGEGFEKFHRPNAPHQERLAV